MTITFIDAYSGFLIAVLPPGAFIGLGLLIALKNIIDKRLGRKAVPSVGSAEAARSAG